MVKENRTTIVLRGNDKEKFEEMMKDLDYDRKVDAFRHLLRFYYNHSPFVRSIKGRK